jgi:hypothetical protein
LGFGFAFAAFLARGLFLRFMRGLWPRLAPTRGSGVGSYGDKELLITARGALLAKEWKESEAKYGDLYKQFDRELRRRPFRHEQRLGRLPD